MNSELLAKAKSQMEALKETFKALKEDPDHKEFSIHAGWWISNLTIGVADMDQQIAEVVRAAEFAAKE